MNNFIFENGTKAILGKGCVKEYLSCFFKPLWKYSDACLRQGIH